MNMHHHQNPDVKMTETSFYPQHNPLNNDMSHIEIDPIDIDNFQLLSQPSTDSSLSPHNNTNITISNISNPNPISLTSAADSNGWIETCKNSLIVRIT